MSRYPVLYVEDNADDVLLLRHAFKRADILDPVQFAQDGQEAVIAGRHQGARDPRRADVSLNVGKDRRLSMNGVDDDDGPAPVPSDASDVARRAAIIKAFFRYVTGDPPPDVLEPAIARWSVGERAEVDAAFDVRRREMVDELGSTLAERFA